MSSSLSLFSCFNFEFQFKAEAEKLASETDKLEEQMEEVRKEGREQVRQVKSNLDTKLAQLEKRAEKLAAEKFELTMDNEEMSKKMKVTQESLRKMEREVGQAQVDIIFNFIIIFVFIPIIIFLITGGEGMVNKPAEERSWNK